MGYLELVSPKQFLSLLVRFAAVAPLAFAVACEPATFRQAGADDGAAAQQGTHVPDRLPGEGGDGGFLHGGGSNDDDDGGVIPRLKPALAIRATGCILCHAQVKAAVITDFGYGSDYYFGNGASGLSPFSGSIYGNHADDWASANIWGSVIVPKAAMPAIDGVTAASLADYLSGLVAAPDATTPKPKIIEEKQVFIGAPSTERILSLGAPFPAAHPQWKYYPLAYTAAEVTGLEAKANGTFVENSGEVACDGDLVVDSVVFLNHLQLRTTQGCRIYATHSVFIQGPITYVGGATNANLQITSSRAILLGLGHGPVTINANDPVVTNNSVQYRLADFWTRGGYFTRETGATQDKLDVIVAESEMLSELTDAALQPEGREVAFSRLLLNAPNIQSRYQGQFNGVIIAEVAISSLSRFNFDYDDVFTRVKLLPLLSESEYLGVMP